ncbi:uncharacterized protein MICPUCDRAFT_63206 [Micromonas pusilla CCMP1545]|uniref:Predicted protein n=1 Tax=Micromonas pusilla (strain CCMP1545) TaxID=564608 RepID=C1MYV6_MICPC|nr:uncharacterized protein MICPUCDRAFT_63206 [Micromonas pusilla CCMP1545]EEH54756.1 predicted protein [Micromonas pusilla CCMP1545]|eukprot:XP_003061106.1 predicted protein [Micromonas pusilla CCMP1545]
MRRRVGGVEVVVEDERRRPVRDGRRHGRPAARGGVMCAGRAAVVACSDVLTLFCSLVAFARKNIATCRVLPADVRTRPPAGRRGNPRRASAAMAISTTVGSVLDVPEAELASMPTRALKSLAIRAGLEPEWEAIASAHRADLVRALAATRREHVAFVRSVTELGGRDVAIALGVREIEDDVRGKSAAAAATRASMKRAMETAVDAAVHVVPSGSGVHIGGGWILTCAHCVCRDGDATDEEESDGDFGGDGDDGVVVVDLTTSPPTSPKKKRKAAAPPQTPRRVGRVKDLVTVDGTVVAGECVHADEGKDLALLKLVAAPPASLRAAGVAPAPAPAPKTKTHRTRVVVVGNPHDWDLELPSGAAPRKMGYTPFWVSNGHALGVLSAEAASEKGLGRQMHTAWTYWGHSGAALFRASDARVVGVHNSWDEGNDAMRHAVCLEDLRAFLDATGVEYYGRGDDG